MNTIVLLWGLTIFSIFVFLAGLIGLVKNKNKLALLEYKYLFFLGLIVLISGFFYKEIVTIIIGLILIIISLINYKKWEKGSLGWKDFTIIDKNVNTFYLFIFVLILGIILLIGSIFMLLIHYGIFG